MSQKYETHLARLANAGEPRPASEVTAADVFHGRAAERQLIAAAEQECARRPAGRCTEPLPWETRRRCV